MNGSPYREAGASAPAEPKPIAFGELPDDCAFWTAVALVRLSRDSLGTKEAVDFACRVADGMLEERRRRFGAIGPGQQFPAGLPREIDRGGRW